MPNAHTGCEQPRRASYTGYAASTAKWWLTYRNKDHRATVVATYPREDSREAPKPQLHVSSYRRCERFRRRYLDQQRWSKARRSSRISG